MDIKSIKKTFWLRMVAAFVAVMLVLTTVPVHSALADTAGFAAPTTYSSSALLNAGNAYVSDNVYVQSTGNNKSAVYGGFGFSIPTGSTINLVEVSVEGHGNKNWKVAVSNNNGTSFSAYATITNTGTDAITVTGGPGTLWGLTGWTAASLNNANFKVKITSAGGSGSNIAYLDQLKVRVTYTFASNTSTTLVVTAPSAGTYGGTVNLQATLTTTSGGSPLSGKTITFALDGFTKGTATTNASGVATLSGVTLATGLSNTLLNVGSYNVGATFSGDPSYAFSSDTDTQVVNPRAVTVTAGAKSKVYGANDPVLTYAFVPALIGSDVFSGALARVAGENVGIHAITQGTLALSANYTITYIGANLTITPLDITVTADDKAVLAGNSDPAFTFGVSQFIGSDTFITTPTCGVGVTHTAVGSYVISCSSGDAGANYNISYVNGTLTVTNKTVLTVTADDQVITYGSSDPGFTFTYNPVVSISGTAPTCSVAVPHTNAGSYHAITCGGGSDTTYEFSYVSGTLTVNPLAVTVTANPQNKTYGSVDPTLTFGFTPALVPGDSFSGVLARNAGENAGIYAITKGALTLGGNYTITYMGANLTISKALLTITADDQIKNFGTADPLFTFQYDGFVNVENFGVIDTPPICGVSVSHASLGNYPIICSGGGDNNYSFSYVNGTLTVLLDTATFVDVPNTYWSWRWIEGLYYAGVTSGCIPSPLSFCPSTVVSRDQMAVFLLKAKHGSSFVPPAPTGVFQDVPTTYWAAAWIEQLAAEGITGGCTVTPKQYCPTTAVTRDQMAVFLLKAKHGSSYVPPTATGVFQDVPTTYWAAAWIEQLAAEGITGGCTTTPKQYCPTTAVARDQMAVFLVKTFGISVP